MSSIRHLAGHTWHGRRGAVSNAFRYGVDFILIDPDASALAPGLFSRNSSNLASLHDADAGGPPGKGTGIQWLRSVLREGGVTVADGRVLLLTQPRLMGLGFNPVSFWLCHDSEDRLRVVVSEVTNTFGDRHSYLCHRDDLGPITAADHLEATKVFHVSPFQPISGGYRFVFDIRPDKISIRIDLTTNGEGLVATLAGPLRPLTNRGILSACLRRPLGAARVLGLIYYQAIKLKLKGAPYRIRPEPPTSDVSR